MGSKPGISVPASVTKPRGRSPNSNRKLSKPQACHSRTTHNDGAVSVSDKLEALRNIIPSQSEEIKPDRLFQETADYIVLLETRVFVLQQLIDFYGSTPQGNQDPVS